MLFASLTALPGSPPSMLPSAPTQISSMCCYVEKALSHEGITLAEPASCRSQNFSCRRDWIKLAVMVTALLVAKCDTATSRIGYRNLLTTATISIRIKVFMYLQAVLCSFNLEGFTFFGCMAMKDKD